MKNFHFWLKITNLHVSKMDGYAYLFLHNELNLGWIFHLSGQRTTSPFFRADQYFDFKIVNVENAAYCNYIVQMAEEC